MPSSVYQSIVLRVSNLNAGEQISLRVSAQGPIAWSTGDSSSSASGLSLTSNSGVIPLSALSVSPSTLQVQTSPGGGSLAFSIQLYLAAYPGIDYFQLGGAFAPNIDITASVGGLQPTRVNEFPTSFSW